MNKFLLSGNLSLTFLTLLSLAFAVEAETCTEAWRRSSAAQSCELTVSPIPESVPNQTQGQAALPFQNCEIHARCETGTTHPENPNSFNTREIHDVTNIVTTVYVDIVPKLKDCAGKLQLKCP